MKIVGINITLRQFRIFLAAFVLCCLSLLVKYYAGQKKAPITDETTAAQHSTKLGKFTFAGELLPFDSPLIIKRYQKAMKENKTFSKGNLEMIKAAKRWFPLMEPILKKYQVPDDFKYISTAESKLTLSYSVKGAGGFWQMMPNTARGLGLEVNAEVDERFHPIKSTEVACKLIKQTHQIFGDWTSVALAYNMGSTALYRLKKVQKMDNVHFIRSNKETERYFYRLMASKDLIENYPKYGYKIRRPSKTSEVKTIHIHQSIPNLMEFAKSQQIPINTLKSFNPWLRANSLTIKPENKHKTYQLILPIVSNEAEEQNSQDVEEPTMPEQKNEEAISTLNK